MAGQSNIPLQSNQTCFRSISTRGFNLQTSGQFLVISLRNLKTLRTTRLTLTGLYSLKTSNEFCTQIDLQLPE